MDDNTQHEDYVREEIDSLVAKYDGDRDFRDDLVTILTQKILEQEKRAKSLRNFPDFYTSEAFPEELEVEIARVTRDIRDKFDYSGAALLVIHSHGIKDINQKFGHKHGDLAVTLILESIRQNTREIDIKGRINGDKFAVFLTDITGERVLEIGNTILQLILASRKSHLANLSANAGLVFYRNGMNAEDLIAQAFEVLDNTPVGEKVVVTGVEDEQRLERLAEFSGKRRINVTFESSKKLIRLPTLHLHTR